MIRIREAREEDAAALLRFMKIAGAETDNLVTDGEGLPVTVEEEALYLRRRREQDNCVTFLAFDEERLVGCIGCDTPSRERVRHGGEIGITVLKDYWGKGIGSKLLSTLVAWAKDGKTGLSKLSLTVRKDNGRAISLYRRFGFREEGTVTRMLRIDGIYRDGLSMVLLLDR
jgi:RimJ/RimL family protein N-acetyltransferase